MSDRIVRIGGASGAWGDSPTAIGQLLTADVDYLMMDYLAEVTMSLLARARAKDPEAGYAPDFALYLAPHLGELKRRGIKVTTNAGGVNPRACKRALETSARELGIDLRVAIVEGDDLMAHIDALREEGIREWRSGEPLPGKLLTANAYLGAIPIARALADGADVVITGRCVDSALALGILMHEFGWSTDDYDRLAAGSLVGHLLECGPQSTGGIFTDWESVPGWENIGYPIAECRADGSFDLTKPAGTGGLVTPATVAEQVLYEIGDPAAYLLPDVTADFSQVSLRQQGPETVHVSGARGRAPTSSCKVSATYQDGWRAVALVSIMGFDAVRKAKRTADALLARGRALLADRGWSDFSAFNVEVLGSESAYPPSEAALAVREVLLRLLVQHDSPKALDVFARELGSVGLSCAQGTTGLIGGRPKAVPVVRLFTFFIEKQRLGPQSVTVADGPPQLTAFAQSQPQHAESGQGDPIATEASCIEAPAATTREISLREMAYARSGDKGDSSNIAIICRDPKHLAHLRRVLTPERIASHFAGLVSGPVTRYEAPGLSAFNFLLENALGGGGMASKRLDAQGKAYGQRALEMKVPAPESW